MVLRRHKKKYATVLKDNFLLWFKKPKAFSQEKAGLHAKQCPVTCSKRLQGIPAASRVLWRFFGEVATSFSLLKPIQIICSFLKRRSVYQNDLHLSSKFSLCDTIMDVVKSIIEKDIIISTNSTDQLVGKFNARERSYIKR